MRGFPFLPAAFAVALTAPSGLASEAPLAVDAPAIKKLVGEQRGRVVLLNFWATWCPPCLVEFPEIVAVDKAFRHRGLSVISVSADSPTRVDSDLLPFLEKHPPDFPIYIMQTDDIGQFMHAIDPDWNGDIPATFFIDRRGEVASKQFSAMKRKQMEQTLEDLFDEPEP